MATTVFFERTIHDVAEFGGRLDLEFGRSSFTGENRIYIKVNGESAMLSDSDAEAFVRAVDSLAGYLGIGNR